MEKRISEPPKKKIKRKLHVHDVGDGDKSLFMSKASTLSDDVVETILSFLPMRSVMKIGGSSKRFNKSWVYNRNLDFGKDFGKYIDKEHYIDHVDEILKFHIGSKVSCLKLFFNPYQMYSKVEQWIEFATKKHVEELDLDFFFSSNEPFQLYKIPSFLLECKSLTVLKLSRCEFEVQQKMNGLNSLKTVVLHDMYYVERFIEFLLSNCLLLENLDLIKCGKPYAYSLKICTSHLKRFKTLKVANCPHVRSVDLDSPTLSSFIYRGKGQEITISGNVSKLNDVMINYTGTIGFPSRVKSPLSNFIHISILSVNSTFLECLRRTNVCLRNLKEFQLFMEHESYCNVYDIVLFMKNCPSLERFFIEVQESSLKCGLYWEIHDKHNFEHFNCLFPKLKLVKVKDFDLEKHEQLEMVKFFLGKAINLETLLLITARYRYRRTRIRDVQMFVDMFKSWRASPKTEVFVSGHLDDASCGFQPKHGKI